MGQNRFRNKDTKFNHAVAPNNGTLDAGTGIRTTTLTFDEAQAEVLTLTGALTNPSVLQFPFTPNDRAVVLVDNQCTAGAAQSLIIKGYTDTAGTTASTGIRVNLGARRLCYWDGSDWNAYTNENTPNMLFRNRYRLVWYAGANGLPQLNAVTDPPAGDTYNTAAMTSLLNADRDFELLGSGASSDDVTIHPEGGIKIETDGGGTNAVIVLPHLNAGQTPWTTITWGTDQETAWEACITTGSAITAQVIHAGLKLTNTPTVATDNDQAFFRYEAGVNSGKWQAVYSIANSDTSADTGVTVAVDTNYHLRIAIDASRIARFYINGTLVATSTALTNAVDLIPYIGILEAAAAAKHMYIRSQAIERNFA